MFLVLKRTVSSTRDGSFEYPQHMFWLRNKKNNFQLHTLIWGPDLPDPELLYACIKIKYYYQGAQWLSGRVLDSRPRGHGFEPHRCHCLVVLEQDTFIIAQ